MNERIKELIKTAGTDTSGKWIGLDNAEKLAELIIRECVNILETRDHSVIVNSVKEIREHFGVK